MNKKIIAFLTSTAIACSAIVGFVVANKSFDSIETKAYTSVSTYYSTVSGTGSTLLNNINTKINQNFTTLGYGGLQAAYAETDVRSDGKIYDIYSNNTNYTPGSSFASSYSNVGDGYNREHTIPKSWWGGSTSKQGCDIYIVLPSDAKVNGMRSNYPYGETTTGTSYKKSGDPSGNRLGSSTSTQYVSGTVFEPFEDRKGDLARVYFYAVAMYLKDGADNGAATKWTSGDGSKVFSASGNNGFVQKYLNMLLAWHTADPVSQWEITRNNNGENVQGNRNPFVDHPSWVDLIWGGTYPSSGLNYENTNGGTASVVNGQISGGSTPVPTVNSVTVSPSSLNLNLDNNQTGNLTATVSVNNGAAQTVTWSSSDTNVATVSNSGVVTAVDTGLCTITATSTVDNTKSGSCTVTVSASGSSGGQSQGTEGESETITFSSLYNANTLLSTINGTSATLTFSKGTGSTDPQYYTSGTAARLYGGNTLNIASSNTIVKIEFTFGSSDGSNTITSSPATYTNGTWTGSATSVTFTIGGTSGNRRISSIKITYEGSGSTKTLSSITLNTTNAQTTFTQGDVFSSSGVIVTAHYNDSTASNVTASATFSGYNMSNTGQQTITVSYTEGGTTKTATYSITVNAAVVSSISAELVDSTKIFYVGDTITKSDISLTNNLGTTITDFTFPDYQFLYEDSAAGEIVTTKEFEITYGDLETSLEVEVCREAYVTPTSSKDTITATDLSATNTTYSDFSVSKGSGATYVGNSAKNSSNIQFNSSSPKGIVSTTSGGTIKSVKITVGSGSNTINVYGKNSAYSSAADLYNTSKQGTLVDSATTTKTITFTTDYTYVGIRSNSGAIYINSIEITYGSEETAANVSNFIMYNDTNNQCTTKLSQAITKLNNMSTSEKNTFWSSSDYVIATARTRLQAWAVHEGKTLSYSNGTYVVSSSRTMNNLISNDSNSAFIYVMIILFGVIGASAVGAYYIIKRKKHNK